jgi:hypothetical protein
MASSRTEIRVGQVATVAGITKFHVVGGRVPAGKRWNLNLIVNNSTGGALTFSSAIVHRYPDYIDGAEVSTGVGSGTFFGDVHPNERWMAVSDGGGNIILHRITPPSIMSPPVQTVATGLTAITNVKFSPDGNWLAVCGSASPYLKVYSFSEIYGAGLAVSNPATLPNAGAASLAWHPAGTFIACSYTGSNVLSAWPWSPGFGTKISDSSAGPGSATAAYRTLKFRPQGDAILSGFNTGTPWIAAWPFTGTFGTKYSDPSTPPTGNVQSLCWAPGGDAFAWIDIASNGFYLQPWSAGFSGTRLNAVATGGGSTGSAIYAVDAYAFVAVGTYGTKYLIGFEWNPLGIVGRIFSGGVTTVVAASGNLEMGTAQQGGVLFFKETAASNIIAKSLIASPATSGGVGMLANAMSVAANSTVKISGHVMNEGERLIVAGSGVLNVMASAVEVTL